MRDLPLAVAYLHMQGSSSFPYISDAFRTQNLLVVSSFNSVERRPQSDHPGVALFEEQTHVDD